MAQLNKIFLLMILSFALASCGVKGKPLAPLEPPPIGNGEPTHFNKKEDKKNNQKR
jgi:predicted small lipoprotein YifL